MDEIVSELWSADGLRDVGRAVESATEKLIATGPVLPPATSMTP